MPDRKSGVLFPCAGNSVTIGARLRDIGRLDHTLSPA